MRDGSGNVIRMTQLEEITAVGMCTFMEILFDVEKPVFDMRSLANLLRPTQDIVIAEQPAVLKKALQ
jgi:hypothetical protein